MSKLDQISTFLLVIETQGFAAAAHKKGVTTAAISQQIKALEQDLGVQLLSRSTRKLALTEIGETYYAQCRQALTILDDAEKSILEGKNEAVGMLRVMANRYFAIKYLVPKIGEFMQANPKLQIDLHLAERFPNMAKEEIDVLFGVSAEGPYDLKRRRITNTRYILCASSDYLHRRGTPKKPEELSQHDYITHSMRQPYNKIIFKNNIEVYLTPILLLNDSFAMRECAILGKGIVNLHDYVVADAVRNGSLVEILRDYQEPATNIYLYYQPSRYLQPKIRRFIDFYTSDDIFRT